MEKIYITILKTWKDDLFEIDMNFSDYLTMKSNLLAEGIDGFFSEKYNEYLKFARFESEKGKVKYLALPEAKIKIELTPQQRVDFEAYKKEILEKTFNGRQQRFLVRREKILKKLAIEENYFKLETTIFKLNDYNKLKAKIFKDEYNKNK